MRAISARAASIETPGASRATAVQRRAQSGKRSLLSRVKRQYVVAGVQRSVSLSGK
jgi:hypothetical protein